MTTNETTIVDIDKVIREEKDGYHCYSHDGSKHLGGPYPTKVQAQRRLRQVEHFKEEDKKDDKDDVKKWLEDLRKQYNPSQPRDKRGRWTSGGVGMAARAAGRAVRGTVNVANAKKVARSAINISKPIIKTVGKAAFAGAMAGLVMGVEHTFSNAGSDVGRAAGAAAAAAARDLKGRAEAKADMYVTAKVGKKPNGDTSVRVQPAQRVSSPSASSYDLSRTAPGGGSFGGPRGGVSVSPFMVHTSNYAKAKDDEPNENTADDVWVVMAAGEFDEKEFGDAVQREVARINKRAAFFGTVALKQST